MSTHSVGLSRSVRSIALASFLISFLLLGAVAAHASKVDPVSHTGTPTCGEYDPDHPNEWVQFRINASDFHNGTFNDGLLWVTISNWNASTSTFDWSSTFDIEVVWVKGGPNSNVYLYDPDQKSDTGLHTPASSSSGGNYVLDHVAFCYEPEDNPSPSPSPTVSPTQTETTVPGGTPGETPGGTSTPGAANGPETNVLGRTVLAETATHAGGFALIGFTMILLGLIAHGVTRRAAKSR